MNVFVDTSALLAVIDRSDERHAAAKRTWEEMLNGDHTLLCHNYVLVETSAVLTQRIGTEAVRVFERDVMPVLRLFWVTREIHEAAVGVHLAAGRRALSLVDCTSFEVMEAEAITEAFALDRDFAAAGFRLVPR